MWELAYLSLGQELGEPNAKIIEWGLKHKNPDIKMQAIWLVGTLREKRYKEMLTKELNNSDSGIATMAAWSLLRIVT